MTEESWEKNGTVLRVEKDVGRRNEAAFKVRVDLVTRTRNIMVVEWFWVILVVRGL